MSDTSKAQRSEQVDAATLQSVRELIFMKFGLEGVYGGRFAPHQLVDG